MVASVAGRLVRVMGSSSNKGIFALMAQKDVHRPEGAQGQADRRRPDRRRAVQLHRRAARHLRPRRPRRAVDSGRHRRQRPRRGAPDQPRRRHAADRAQLLPPRRGRATRTWRIWPTTRSTPRPSTCSARRRSTANPKLAEQIIKAHAEAIKRFYDDKAFAVKAYIGLRQAAGSRRRAHLRPLHEGQHLRARAVRAGRRVKSIVGSRPIRASRPS